MELELIIAEIERRKKEVNVDENGSFCSWADENTWMVLDEIQDFINNINSQ